MTSDVRLHKTEKKKKTYWRGENSERKGLEKREQKAAGNKTKKDKKKEDNGKQMKQYGDKISASSEKATWRSEQKKKQKKHGRPKSNE